MTGTGAPGGNRSLLTNLLNTIDQVLHDEGEKLAERLPVVKSTLRALERVTVVGEALGWKGRPIVRLLLRTLIDILEHPGAPAAAGAGNPKRAPRLGRTPPVPVRVGWDDALRWDQGLERLSGTANPSGVETLSDPAPEAEVYWSMLLVSTAAYQARMRVDQIQVIPSLRGHVSTPCVEESCHVRRTFQNGAAGRDAGFECHPRRCSGGDRGGHRAVASPSGAERSRRHGGFWLCRFCVPRPMVRSWSLDSPRHGTQPGGRGACHRGLRTGGPSGPRRNGAHRGHRGLRLGGPSATRATAPIGATGVHVPADGSDLAHTGQAGDTGAFDLAIPSRPVATRPTTQGGSDLGASRYGRYLLKRSHAKGGMGEIWLAEDPVIGRSVAAESDAGPAAGTGPPLRGGSPGHGPARAPGHRAGPRAGRRRPGPAVLRDEVCQRPHSPEGHRGVPCGGSEQKPREVEQLPPAPDLPFPVPDRGLRPQPGSAAPGPEARKRHDRPLRRDALARLGHRQGPGSTGGHDRP